MGMGVTVDFNANLVKFSGQVDRMVGQLDKFQVRAETMSARVNKSLGALGIGVSVAGLAAFVKSGIDAADALNDMSDRTGIAVEKLAGFQLATKLADTDMDAFAKSANKLSIFIAKNSDEMKKLGISAKDPADAFLQFADVFSKIEDPQKRAAFGAAAMGKSYAEMAPLLLQGGDALRQQVKDGQEMSGITTEQAKAAADLNDKLDTLNKRFTSLTEHTIGPLIPGLSNIAERFDYAAKKAQGFSDVFTEDFWQRVIAGSDPQMAIAGIKKIDEQIKAQQGIIDRINKYPKLAAVENYDGGEEQRKLDILVERRGEAVKKLSMQNNPPAPIVIAAKPNGSVINAVIKANGEAGQSTEQLRKAEESRRDGILKTIGDLKAEISVSGESIERQKILLEIHNATAKATGSESEQIRKLIEAKYDLADSDAILAEGEKLALKQRTDMESEYDRLNQKFNGNLLDLNKGISDAMDARAQGIIPNDVELKNVLDKMGQDYNALTDNAKTSTDQMSEYAIQGARSMQSAFSDFLFDPFKDGADGMAANFLNVVRRMAADAASAKIMEGLLGKTGVADGGGLLGSLFSSVADLFSGGGFNGSGPLLSFANATGNVFSKGEIVPFAKGGVFDKPTTFPMSGGNIGLLGEAGPEAIFPLARGSDGKLGVKVQSGGEQSVGGVSITTQVSVTGGTDASSNNMQALGGMINARIKEVILTEKRPGGLLA